MKNKIFYTFLFFLVLSLISSGYLLYKNSKKNIRSNEFVFSKLIENIDKLDKIVIYNNQNKYNFYLEDGLWKLKESNDYYANTVVFEFLFSDIYNARYYSFIDDETEEMFVDYSIIEFFDKEDNIIDNIKVGNKTEQNHIFIKKDNATALAFGDFVIPKHKSSLIEQPRFKILEKDIFRIYNKDGKSINISSLGTAIPRDLSSLFFEDVIQEELFIVQNEIEGNKTIEIETNDGLVLLMIVDETSNSEYWASIKISTNKMPKTEIKGFVEENSFLYEGWKFKLFNELGFEIFKRI